MIGSCRGAGCKDSALGVVEKWADRELRRGGTMEQVNKPEALEALDVSEPLCEAGKDLDHTLGLAGRGALDWGSGDGGKGSVDDTDGLQRSECGTAGSGFRLHSDVYTGQSFCIEYNLNLNGESALQWK